MRVFMCAVTLLLIASCSGSGEIKHDTVEVDHSLTITNGSRHDLEIAAGGTESILYFVSNFYSMDLTCSATPGVDNGGQTTCSVSLVDPSDGVVPAGCILQKLEFQVTPSGAPGHSWSFDVRIEDPSNGNAIMTWTVSGTVN